MSETRDQEDRKVRSGFLYGLAAACFASLLTIYGAKPDLPLEIAIYCFCIAIPVNVGSAIASQHGAPEIGLHDPISTLLYMVGPILSVVGLAALIADISEFYLLTFVGSISAVTALYAIAAEWTKRPRP